MLTSIQPSPAVVCFGYDAPAQCLDVTFQNGEWRRYRRVSHATYLSMKRAADATEFFRSSVLGRFAYTVPEAEACSHAA